LQSVPNEWCGGLGAASMRHCVAAVRAAARSAGSQVSKRLRIRELAIVDERSVERLILSAELPGPQVMGKRPQRRSAASGIQLNAANGNERGE
jgi:hypothetical protein